MTDFDSGALHAERCLRHAPDYPYSITRLEVSGVTGECIEPTISAAQCRTFHAFIRYDAGNLISPLVCGLVGDERL